MLPPDDPRAPKYWPNETSGALQPVVLKYLKYVPLTPREVNTMKSYLLQWVQSPVWGDDEEMKTVRELVLNIHTRDDIDRAIEAATEIGADPL